MNVYCKVVISGQETGSEGFVGPCHMTSERLRDKDPLYKSESVNEFFSSVALRPKARLHGGQGLKQTQRHAYKHTQVLTLTFAFTPA